MTALCRREFSRETSHKIDASDEFVDLDELVRLMRLADPAGFAYDITAVRLRIKQIQLVS